MFKFFKNFQWRYVLVDSWLPCYISNDTPVFGRCSDPDELWVPLVEKAYAKLHGCYETLISGFLDDALHDMTGYVSEKLNLHDKNGCFPNPSLPMKSHFFDYILSRWKEGCMMGCARKTNVTEEKLTNGIITGHAYGITDVLQMKVPGWEVQNLLTIRNPWGRGEWNGNWSDNSEEVELYWAELEKYLKSRKDEKFNLNEEDGIFFISFEDWSWNYNKLYITVDFPDDWRGVWYISYWNDQNSGGLPTGKDPAMKQNWAKNP